MLSGAAHADGILDYIRDYDLNDYALGVAVSTAHSPFAGAKNSDVAYPLLTSFRPSAFTDDWLLIRDGELGFRWVSGDWEVGALGRLQSGFGADAPDQLRGMQAPEMAIEVGPMLGWRGSPVHFNVSLFADVLGRHGGLVGEASLELPLRWPSGYLVPALELSYLSDDYVDYYYSVAPFETTPLRPAYVGRSSFNPGLKVHWGYAVRPKWLLFGKLGVEELGTSIRDSPIVDRDRLWSANLGLAYNDNVFQPKARRADAVEPGRWTILAGAFRDGIDTTVVRDGADGTPGLETDIERLLGAADEKTVGLFEARLRLTPFHSIEVGYFELERNAAKAIEREIVFGDEVFAVGTNLVSRVRARDVRLSYAYSLIRDAQKELAFTAGVHFALLEAELTAAETRQSQKTRAGTPLPVVGVRGSTAIGSKTDIAARVEFFRMDFDRFEGSLADAAIDIRHALTDGLSVGAGYTYYAMNLSSSDTSVNGRLKVRHHGPMLFFVATFD